MKKPLVIVSKSSPIEARPFGLPIEALPQLKEFAKQLDALKVHRDRMWAAAESLFPQDDDGKPPIITEAKLESAKCILSQYRQSLLRNTLVNGDIERAEAELLAMVPESEWWDVKRGAGDVILSHKVRMSAIARAVKYLLGQFLEQPADPESFIPALIADVYDVQPRPFGIEDAKAELRRATGSKSPPSIKKILDVLEAAQAKWMDRLEAFTDEGPEAYAEYLAELIERAAKQGKEETP